MSDPSQTPPKDATPPGSTAPENSAPENSAPENSAPESPAEDRIVRPEPAGSAPTLADQIVAAIKTVYDPEIPVDVYELGLIYNIGEVDASGHVDVIMTLTSPACPVAGTLPGDVQDRVESVEGVESATVEVVWDPQWNPSMMSEAARLELGMF